MFTVRVTRRTSAPPERVWHLLADHSQWPRWAMVQHASLEREGDPAPDGIGAIRVLGTGKRVSREEVIGFEPPHRFSYRLLEGLPVDDYESTVTLEPRHGGGTEIVWHSTFDGRGPALGAAMKVFITFVLWTFARALARAAEQD